MKFSIVIALVVVGLVNSLTLPPMEERDMPMKQDERDVVKPTSERDISMKQDERDIVKPTSERDIPIKQDERDVVKPTSERDIPIKQDERDVVKPTSEREIVKPLSERDVTKQEERDVNMQERAVDMSMMMMDMPDNMNHTQCIWKPEEKILSCKGGVETVECDAVGELSAMGDRKFNLFGIGVMPERSDISKVDSVRYWLYPRKLDNSSYMNHSIVVDNGKVVDLCIYFSEKTIDVTGIRVTDMKCWNKVVRMFVSASRVPHMVKLETEPTIVQEVPVIGEVMIYDKVMQKRWLYGYGWSPYSWGWSGLYSPYYYGLGLGWGK